MNNFRLKCYEIVKKIPRGKILTYKDVANILGTRAYRAVGTAMKMNNDKSVPCHRIINSNGFIGGYNGFAGNKLNLLKKEGIASEDGFIDIKKYRYDFKE